MNTFDQAHIDGIARALPEGVRVARSRAFTTSVVIGRPGTPGSVMVAFLEKGNYQDRSAWLTSHFPELDPKTVADGDTVPGKTKMYTEEVYYWADMLELVKEVFN